MSKLNQIENKLLELDGGTFQKLADAYLHKKGYGQINPIGSVVGADKTKKGTPDTFIPLPNGKYVFAEYTTQQEKVFEKLQSDLGKCLNEAKTGISVSKIEEIVFCHTSTFSPEQQECLSRECQKRGININVFGIGPISYDLYQKYPGLARDFLGVEVDTGQIVSPSEFVDAYNKSRFSTRLDTGFRFRESEVEQVLQALDKGDLIIISGRPGVGKSRLVLECLTKFVKDHNDYKIRCIFNRGPDLFEDLRVHFSESGNFLIFVDDANRLSRFDYITQLLCEQREDQQIKVIATVRDYALERVRETTKHCGTEIEIELLTMQDDEIKQLIKGEFEIMNRHYLDRIADIAKGNPRLAVMAAQVAKKENTLASINDVTALYEEYFSSIRIDLEEINQSNLLRVAGIIVFFRSVDRSNKEVMRAIETAFESPDNVFWEAAQRLHELELFDMYENEVVRVADQALATYLFYLSFFKEKVADFGILLEHFFPALRSRFVDAINPTLNTFNSQTIIEAIRPHIDQFWERMEKSGNEEKLLLLMQTFWYMKRTETLLHIRKKIEELPSEPIGPAHLDFKPVQDPKKPSLLVILSLFRHVEDDTFRTALELMLYYLIKQQKELPHVLHLLAESLCFNHKDYLRGFSIQRAVVDVLWKRASDGNDLFGRLFLAVAGKYLHTKFHTTEDKGDKAITIINFEIPYTPELLELRKTIWIGIFKLYAVQELRERSLDALHGYVSSRIEVSSSEIMAYDSIMILPFIENMLDPTVLRHCIIVQEYLDRLRNHKVAFNETMCLRFESEVWTISQLLTLDLGEMRTLDMDYEKFSQYKYDKIIDRFSRHTFADYEKFLDQCYEIDRTINQDHKRLQFRNGIVSVLFALAETNPGLFINVLEEYMVRGEQFKINAGPVIQRLAKIAGTDGSFEILNRFNYPTKRTWLLWWHQLLSDEATTKDRLNQLYTLYQEASSVDLLNDFDFLLKYRQIDLRVVQRVTEIILCKLETDPDVAQVLYWLFNPYREVNKILEDAFADDLSILKRAYFASIAVGQYTDYDGQTLSRIMNLDETFIIEYIDQMYKAKEHISKYDGLHDYSFIWKRNDFEPVMTRVAEWMRDHEKETGLLSFTGLNIFFEQRENDKNNLGLKEKQDRLLRQFIENRHEDADFMEMVFAVIAEFPPPRRIPFVFLFLEHDKDFDAFKNLTLEPYIHSHSGSAVPMLQERLEYFESLTSFANTIEFLQHKLYLEGEVQAIRSQIEYEKKRDFIGE